MKTGLEQLPITLPNTNRLLGPNDTHKSHPPIYLKLSQNALEMLAQSNSLPDVQLSLSDSNSSLRINDLEFPGSLSKESGHVEVYLPEKNGSLGEQNEGRFRSHGQINSRISIKPGEPGKPSTDRFVGMAEMTVSKIENLLASKPANVKDLSLRAKIPESEVLRVLKNIAEPHTGDLFILKKRLRSQIESKETQEPRKVTKLKSRNAEEPKSASRSFKNTGDDKRIQEAVASIRHTEETPPKAVRSVVSTSSLPAIKRRSTPASTEAKRLKSDKSPDMYELARKFRSAYDEYLELYSLLSKRETRPASQVQKLVAMHNQLAQWKKTLWSNARSKSQVK